MAQSSKIEWTEVTWNPVTGCTKTSPGCSHCYAERIAYRFAGLHGFPERPNHFNVVLHPDRLEQPLKWRKPRLLTCMAEEECLIGRSHLQHSA